MRSTLRKDKTGGGLIDYRFVLMRTKDNHENLLQMADSFESAGVDWLKSYGLGEAAARVISQITEFIKGRINEMEVGDLGICQLQLEESRITAEFARKGASCPDFLVKRKTVAFPPAAK